MARVYVSAVMNLHAIVSGAINTINPAIPCTLSRSNGQYTIADDGTRTPSYSTFIRVACQFQALSNPDLAKMGGLNLEGVNTAIYVNGQLDGAERVSARGGDLVTRPTGEVYLVTQVLEDWGDWTKVSATLQNGR